MEFPMERWQAWIAGATAVLVFGIMAWLIAAPFGRSVRATRDHEPAASLAGINTAATKIAAFAISAGCAALSGAVLTQILGLAAPGAFGVGLSLSLLVGTVVGGRQRLLGAFLGAAMLALMPELIGNWVTARELPDRLGLNLPGLVYGGLLLLTVGLAPGGLASISRPRRR